MAIRLRNNNRYVVDYYPNGRKGRRVIFQLAAGTTEQQAKIVEQELRSRKKQSALAPIDGSISRLAPHYIKFCRMHQSPETADDKKSHFKKYLTPFFGHMRIPELTNTHLTLYKQQTKEKAFVITNKKTGAKKPITNRTINKGMSYLSAFLKWAEEELNIAPAQPLRFRKLPSTRPVPIVLSLEEAMAFINSANRLCHQVAQCKGHPKCIYRVPYNVMFKVFFYLGLRNSAVRHLAWEDMDWARHGVKTVEKGNKRKWHPLPDDLYDELKELHTQSTSRWIFPSPRDPNKPIDNILKAVARARKAARITKRVYPHLLRHSIGTHLIDSDVDIRQIQAFLDHAQVSTTELYTQVSMEKKRQALEKAGIKTTKM